MNNGAILLGLMVSRGSMIGRGVVVSGSMMNWGMMNWGMVNWGMVNWGMVNWGKNMMDSGSRGMISRSLVNNRRIFHF